MGGGGAGGVGEGVAEQAFFEDPDGAGGEEPLEVGVEDSPPVEGAGQMHPRPAAV